MRNQRNTAEALPSTETVVTTTFDSQGRRTEYKSVTNGTQNTWLRFLYDGYMCIQALYSNSPYNVFKEFVWDPTEPVATRPLVFRYAPNSLNLLYAFDGNKNVSDVFYRLTANGIGAHYDYAPFGATTRTHRDSSASFDIVSLNPFRFSSEYYDSELDLIYYNYRHYSPTLGRFLSRDPIEEQGGLNLYAFVGNSPIIKSDCLGQDVWIENTPAAGGWHRRVCVNTWARSYVVTNLWGIKFCCHENKKYVRTGKYCISFGDKDLDTNYSSGNSEGENAPPRNTYNPPPGFEHVPGGSGVVYSDNKDLVISSHASFSQQCGKDIRSLDYMLSLIGMEGNYTVLWNNCRDFSEALFEHLSSEGF